MKLKTVALALFISTLFTQICIASQFNNTRWFPVYEDSTVQLSIDTQTIKYKRTPFFSSCSNHKTVTVWVLYAPSSRQAKGLSLEEYDLDCRKYRILSTTWYDKNGNIISSAQNPNEQYRYIAPGTRIEYILEILSVYWEANAPE